MPHLSMFGWLVFGLTVCAAYDFYAWLSAKSQMLQPIELCLRRATHFPAVIAVGYYAAKTYGIADALAGSAGVRSIIKSPSTAPFLIGAALLFLYLLSTWISNLRLAWGVKDGTRATAAFFKLILGVGFIYWSLHSDWPDLTPIMRMLGLWLIITNALRLFLLLASLRSARRIVERGIEADEFNWDA